MASTVESSASTATNWESGTATLRLYQRINTSMSWAQESSGASLRTLTVSPLRSGLFPITHRNSEIDVQSAASGGPAENVAENHFQILKSALVEQAGFTVHASAHQRLIYPTTPAVIVDLIPFGGVEREDRTIAWPPEEDFVMRVAGFSQNNRNSAIRSLTEWAL